MAALSAYAGIGTRDPTEEQLDLIMTAGAYLADKCQLHTGGAIGADQVFSSTTLAFGGSVVLHLPWSSYEQRYIGRLPADQRERVEVRCLRQEDAEAFASVDQHHPKGAHLKSSVRRLHARNYRILVPEAPVGFVLALPKLKHGKATGGTMQGIRLASALGIPIIRLDQLGWSDVKQRLDRLLGIGGLWRR